MRRSIICGIVLVVATINVFPQRTPDLRFGGHQLGESAGAFFSIATMTDSKGKTKEYCSSLLENPKATEKNKSVNDSLRNLNVTVLSKKDFVVFDVQGCETVSAALRGENTNVGATFASELGKGGALFASGKVVGFNLTLDKPYTDVVADMERRFGFSGQKYRVARAGAWPDLEERRWEANGILASVFQDLVANDVIVLVGYLQPPYDSLLRGIPAQGAVWKVFTSRGGWKINYLDDWQIKSCQSCQDPAAQGVFVDFSPTEASQIIVKIEPLADRPTGTSVDEWLKQISVSSNVNPHVHEQKLMFHLLRALKVLYRTPDNEETESVYVVGGMKTFALEFSSGNRTGVALEKLPGYDTYRNMLYTFRVQPR